MSADELRREGMAEAVVRIVLSRRVPQVTAETWCEILGLDRSDVSAALERLKTPRALTDRVMPTRPPVPTASTARPPSRVRRAHPGNPGVRRRACPFCPAIVQPGKYWTGHMARFHAEEWAAHLEAELAERYGPECPDCGQRIEVHVHVAEHVCSASGEAA